MKTVTGLYDNYESATQPVRDMEGAGIPHSDISIVANNADDRYSYGNVRDSDAGKGAGIGAGVGGAAGLLAGLGLLAIPGLGPVVAAGSLPHGSFSWGIDAVQSWCWL